MAAEWPACQAALTRLERSRLKKKMSDHPADGEKNKCAEHPSENVNRSDEVDVLKIH